MTKNPPKLLLNDPDVRRWHDNLRRSSILTGSIRLRRLNIFCDRVGMTPRQLAREGRDDPMKAENILLDHVSWMEEKKYAPGYIKGTITAIKSWFEYNRIEIRRKIRIANMDVPTTIQNETIPDREQLRKILNAADPRCRVVISLMAFSGIRPQVLGMADKSDGLALSDLPDLVLDGGDTRFSRIPAMVVVRPNLSKIRKKYFTFLAEEGCKYVLGYLRERMARGETLKPGSPLVTSGYGYRLKGWSKLDGNTGRFLTTGVISKAVRPAIWSVIKVRPYALRAYFDSQLLIAESHGCMTHAYRQFFMGHKGDMEARYTTNKGRLTEQMTEDMRRAYEQSQAFLSTDVAQDSDADRRRMLIGMWQQQARMYGLNPDAMIAGGILDGVRDAPARRQAEEAPVTTAPEADHGAPDAEKKAVAQDANAAANGDAQRQHPFESRIVGNESELLAGAAEGWDLIKDLPGERFLLRRKIPRS
ncbi:MAG: site-specific integrase [Thaumarchaeota archaeon]|nr:site-specific integrase [Nitrososphaerota archaeon]